MSPESEKSRGMELDFESALKELEAVVEALESGDLSLSDSLSRFERGVSLSRQCHDMLEQARQTVSVLTDPEQPGSERSFATETDQSGIQADT